MKKILVKILLFILIFFTAYYFFTSQSARFLQQEQKILANQHSILLQNRLAITELARQNPESHSFQENKANILSILKQTNKDGLKALDKNESISHTAAMPQLLFNSSATERNKKSSQLLQKNKSILTRQKNLFAPLYILDEKLQNIFIYDPQIDLKTPDLLNNEELLATRAKNARKGLHDIEKHIKMLDLKTHEIHLFQIKNKEAQEALGALIESIEQGDTITMQHNQTETIKLFKQLKQLAWTAELSLIQSDASVKLLTEQTNLLHEYNFYLQKYSVKK